MYRVDFSMAKTKKYAVSYGGDSLEIVERPRGGFSVIMADGQGSGKSAKSTSSMVVNKAAALIAEGARDGAVARAVHDMLYASKDGKVSSTLVIASLDYYTGTLVLSRNGNNTVFVWQKDEFFRTLDSQVNSIGFHYYTKPEIVEVPLKSNLCLLAVTDGVTHAGRRYGNQLQIPELRRLIQNIGPNASRLADTILHNAVARDQGRPADDMSVFAVVVKESDEDLAIRRMTMSFPYQEALYGRK